MTTETIGQLQYDIAEFVINNKDEILHYINQETSHLSYCEVIFSSYPEMYSDLLEKARRDKLRELVGQHFPATPETLSLIIDQSFVNITLES